MRSGYPNQVPIISQCNFSLRDEELSMVFPTEYFHVEKECSVPEASSQEALLSHEEDEGFPERAISPVRLSRAWILQECPPEGWEKRKVLHRPVGGQRASYDLRERICIGSMTALESTAYQRVPTDEAEAQMLASADLDDMKSKRLPTCFYSLNNNLTPPKKKKIKNYP
nr:PREDICTED: anion exchange protein 2-like [Latimeria chalumnae]|eukprot:XP_014341457.1 PREDICTED: anion exchange protein 2-like [Latimeria chalumnae]